MAKRLFAAAIDPAYSLGLVTPKTLKREVVTLVAWGPVLMGSFMNG